jgi:hypothetical protein
LATPRTFEAVQSDSVRQYDLRHYYQLPILAPTVSTTGCTSRLRTEMAARAKPRPWPLIRAKRVAHETPDVPDLRLSLTVGFVFKHAIVNNLSLLFQTHMFSRELLDLCSQFEALTSPHVAAKAPPEALTLRIHQKQDIYSLGSLLTSLLRRPIRQTLNTSNPDLVDFIGACQSGKGLDHIAEHKYLGKYREGRGKQDAT